MKHHHEEGCGPHGHHGDFIGPGPGRCVAAGRRYLGRRRHPDLRQRRRDRQGRIDQAPEFRFHFLRRFR